MTRRKLLKRLFWPTLWLALTGIYGVAVTEYGFLQAVSVAS